MDPINDFERRWMDKSDDLSDGTETFRKMGEALGKTIANSMNDIIEVNHPKHYCNRKMEAIDIIEMIIEIEHNPKVAYNLSNVLKYLLRFRDKGTPVKDLQKAQWYLARMIEKIDQEK